MPRTRIEAIAAVAAKMTGQPVEEVLLELKAVIDPTVRSWSPVFEVISDEEYDRILALDENTARAFMSVMRRDCPKHRLPYDKN